MFSYIIFLIYSNLFEMSFNNLMNANDANNNLGKSGICDVWCDDINNHINSISKGRSNTIYSFPSWGDGVWDQSQSTYIDCLPLIKSRLRDKGFTVAEGTCVDKGSLSESYD